MLSAEARWIKEAAMGSVARCGSNDQCISVTALTLESGCSTFIKHRFPAVGSFGWVVFGLVLGGGGPFGIF